MGMTEHHSTSGRLTLELHDAAGRLVARRRADNLITTAGRRLLAQLFTGQAQGPALAIAVGSAATAPKPEDSALGSRVDAAPAAITKMDVLVQDGVPRVLASVSATFPAGGGAAQALQEAGIEITLPGQAPVLYNHVSFPVITRAGNLAMTLTWEVYF
ncbi:MAG: hypothetical protein JNJ60_22995 [Rhodocyclaceae bacterium]|nr:hypothetical protein [Rhodocyclaceae bacterium]